MARVLVAANSSWNIQNFRAGLIRELLRNGYEVVTVSPDLHGIEIDEVPLRHRRCKLDRSSTNPLRDLECILSFARILRDERPDVFLSYTIKPNIYGTFVCGLFNIPAIPNVSGLGTSFLARPFFRRVTSLMYRLALGRAKVVFFQNPDDRELFVEERLVRPGRGRILPGSGVSLSHFSPAELPDGVHFLMIARLLGDKGVREYVEAARRLRNRLPAASFSLLGELDRDNPTAVGEQEFQEWIDEGVVRYLGSTADVRPFIESSTVVVLPSYREGLPRVLLEAAAMARPLIGTDVPGCRDVVRDRLTGFLCRPRDVDSLVAAMERFAATSHDRRARMGAKARIMIETEFDERFVVRAYVEAVRELAV